MLFCQGTGSCCSSFEVFTWKTPWADEVITNYPRSYGVHKGHFLKDRVTELAWPNLPLVIVSSSALNFDPQDDQLAMGYL